MKTLNRYIMKSAMFPFVLGLGGFIVFVSIELLYQLSEVIVSYKVPIWRLFELLYYNVPMFTVMGVPVGVLLALFWILSQMGSNSELMALQVHGVSFKKIVIPFLILGLIFSVFSYLLSDFVVPDFNHRASVTLTRYVFKQPESTVKANQFLDVGDNRYFYVKRFDTEKATFEDVLLYDLSQSDMRIYYARQAIKSEDTGRWKLVEGRVFTMDRQGLMKLDTVFQETEIDLTKDLDEFIRDTSKRAQDLTSKELWVKIEAYKKMGIRTNSLEVEFHTRFANALGPIIVAFLGVPLSLTFNIKSKSWSVIFTFILIVLYQGSGAWMSALGKDGETLTPFLASWLPDIGFAIIGFILFILLDTKLMYRLKEMFSRLFTFSVTSRVFILLLFLFFWQVTGFCNNQTTSKTGTDTTAVATPTAPPKAPKEPAPSLPTTNPLIPASDELLIKISADEMDYNGREKTITLTGNVIIEYDQMTLQAPRVTAYLENEEWVDYFLAESEGATKVTLKQEKEYYQAQLVKAYVKRNAFFLYHLRGTFKQKNQKGQEKPLILVSDKSRSKTFVNKHVTEVQTGYLTTCDLDKPHYRFEAGYIVVKESKEIIAYDLLLYVLNIPILPYPVYFADMTKEKQPVEISFTLSGEGGLQTHLEYTYLDRANEKGVIKFDTVEKGPKKGATIVTENKFALPFDIIGYLNMTHKSTNDFKDQTRILDFNVSKTFENKLIMKAYYKSTRVLENEATSKRDGSVGLEFSGPFFLKGLSFSLKANRTENRSLTASKNTYEFPTFTIGSYSQVLFKDFYPVTITLDPFSLTGKAVTPAATSIVEALDVLDYTTHQSIKIGYSALKVDDVTLVKPMKTDLVLDMDFNKRDFTNYFIIKNTVPFQNVGFQFGQKDKAFVGFDSAYTVRLGYIRHRNNQTAWRYSENVLSEASVNLWWLNHQMTHNYVFLIADGENYSALGEDVAERNALSMTTILQVPFLFSKFTLKNGFDFMKKSDRMSDPTLISNTTIKVQQLSFDMTTTSPYSLELKQFVSTVYTFNLTHPYGNSSLDFTYVYEQPDEKNKKKGEEWKGPVDKITNSNSLRFNNLGLVSSFTEDLNFTWTTSGTATETGGFELNKLIQKNTLKLKGFGTLKSLQNTFDFEYFPQKPAKDRWSYINDDLSLEFDKFTTTMTLKWKPRKSMYLGLVGTFPGFSFKFDTNYNIETFAFQSMGLTLNKDLHCWENTTEIKFDYIDSKFKLASFATTFRIKSFTEKFFRADPVKKTFDLSIF